MSGSSVSAAEIRWMPSPLPEPDLAAITDDDVLALALCEADACRELARAAIHALSEKRVALDRKAEAHHRLVAEYRALRRGPATREATA